MQNCFGAYGFGKEALTLIYNYLHGRRQRVKVNGSVSSWRTTTQDVPQGSVLGPFLFNIYMNDLLMINGDTEVCDYAHDTTYYAYDTSAGQVIRKLEAAVDNSAMWLDNNYMKLNAEKCHLLIFGKNRDKLSLSIGDEVITESKEEKLLGVIIDTKLTFKSHVTALCKKPNQKLHAFSRISSYVDREKLRQIMKAFLLSQFNYCPLIWMFSDRQMNNRSNSIHEKALRIVYNDTSSKFPDLLRKDNSVSIHQWHLQLLMSEIFKTNLGLNPCFMKRIFAQKSTSYNLRMNNLLDVPRPQTVSYGIQSAVFLGCSLWLRVPDEAKTSRTIDDFNNSIKHWKGQNKCLCKICRNCVAQLGFLT